MLDSLKYKKKYTIKVPETIKVIYSAAKSIILFMGPLQTKSLRLRIKVFLEVSTNTIIVSDLPLEGTLPSSLKNRKKLQGTTVAKIKHSLIEANYVLYSRLNLVGVGYRVFPYEISNNQLYFKLGYSHLVYFKIPNTINTFTHKYTKLFLFGNCSFEQLKRISAQIRLCKCPEPYKGKGILYDQETISLKKGKKI